MKLRKHHLRNITIHNWINVFCLPIIYDNAIRACNILVKFDYAHHKLQAIYFLLRRFLKDYWCTKPTENHFCTALVHNKIL